MGLWAPESEADFSAQVRGGHRPVGDPVPPALQLLLGPLGFLLWIPSCISTGKEAES